jgi:cytochrome c-type biogenesis protein
VATVMTALGIATVLMGIAFGGMIGSGWYYVVGIVAILMGLQLLDLFRLPLPQFVSKMPVTTTDRIGRPFILGLAFGAATSPCGTPFLTAMLGFISQTQNIALGGISLFSYALGQTVLLLVVGLFTGLLKHMATLRRVGGVFNRLSAVVFILAGLLFIALGAGWLDPLAFY